MPARTRRDVFARRPPGGQAAGGEGGRPGLGERGGGCHSPRTSACSAVESRLTDCWVRGRETDGADAAREDGEARGMQDHDDYDLDARPVNWVGEEPWTDHGCVQIVSLPWYRSRQAGVMHHQSAPARICTVGTPPARLSPMKCATVFARHGRGVAEGRRRSALNDGVYSCYGAHAGTYLYAVVRQRNVAFCGSLPSPSASPLGPIR